VTSSHVLFLCVHNAGRSQMAAAWLEHLSAGRAVALSGGSEPASQVNSVAVQVMSEVGIDIGRTIPKRWSDADLDEADVVVTMGCGDSCPLVPGKRYEDWAVDDPADEPIERVREIRDDIKRRVEDLLGGLAARG
jgi:arsenate reductase (thioredoxin)